MKELGFCFISLAILSSITHGSSDFLGRVTSNNLKTPAIISNLIDKKFIFIWNEIHPGGT